MTTPTYPVLKYPNYTTPRGEYILFSGRVPEVVLTSPDGTAEFYLMGGRAITDRVNPESVRLKNISKLLPGWQMIDQKGATQDGVTFVTALYDPSEPELTVEARGRDPQHLRKVLHDFYGSLDPIKTSKLAFFSQNEGYWWANVRWTGAPDEPLEKINVPRQVITVKLRNDDAFWRTYDHTDIFRFSYADASDLFTVDYSASNNLGPNWPQRYSGAGAGTCSTTTAASGITEARWYTSGGGQRMVVNGPKLGFNTTTNDQVIEMVLGRPGTPLFSLFDPDSFNDLYGRMNRDGSNNWLGDGIRARIGVKNLLTQITLSRFNNFVETVMRTEYVFNLPHRNDVFTLVCGTDSDSRQYRIMRNGIEVLTHKEVGTGSSLGASYRGVGFGMEAGSGAVQKIPSWVKDWHAGDNATVAQSGYLQRVNVGDQPMYDDYTLFGPGTFKIWDGPDADSYVQFGPLLPNQIAFLRTHPGKRSVHDLTSIPPTPQQLTVFQQALEKYYTFAYGNNTPPLVQTILSKFGILPPQGQMYTLLSGRFSDKAAIPPKPSGKDATPYYVQVSVDGGNAGTKIIASGTPFRRYPI